MTKRIWTLILAMMMMIAAQGVIGEGLTADELTAPLAALKVSLPDAEVNYAIKEREDGRYEWKIFFTQNGSLGECKIWEDSNTIRKVEMYDRGTENALTADKAVARLIQEKGEMTIIELDLDWDDGALRYEGEAEMNGKRYEFEMTAEGRIIEWERD